MKSIQQCPVCSGDLAKKKVEKLLRGGFHTAVVKVNAYVCLHCGEHIYEQKTVRRFEEIRNKLERQQTTGFHLLGKLFQVRA